MFPVNHSRNDDTTYRLNGSGHDKIHGRGLSIFPVTDGPDGFTTVAAGIVKGEKRLVVDVFSPDKIKNAMIAGGAAGDHGGESRGGKGVVNGHQDAVGPSFHEGLKKGHDTLLHERVHDGIGGAVEGYHDCFTHTSAPFY